MAWISLSNQVLWKTTLKSHDASRDIYSHCIYLLFVFLKRLASPAVERRCAYSPNPDRGRTVTTPHRQERRGRDQTAENKENIAVQDKDVDIFALPPPRTPVSSKKNARPNKNVLTTPNQNANGTKTNAVTPKGKTSLCYSTSGSNEVQTMQGFSPPCSLFVYRNCLLFQTRALKYNLY